MKDKKLYYISVAFIFFVFTCIGYGVNAEKKGGTNALLGSSVSALQEDSVTPGEDKTPTWVLAFQAITSIVALAYIYKYRFSPVTFGQGVSVGAFLCAVVSPFLYLSAGMVCKGFGELFASGNPFNVYGSMLRDIYIGAYNLLISAMTSMAKGDMNPMAKGAEKEVHMWILGACSLGIMLWSMVKTMASKE